MIIQTDGVIAELRDEACCKNREIPISGKKGKIVISIKNPEFILYISDNKTDFTIEIVSRNLAST